MRQKRTVGKPLSSHKEAIPAKQRAKIRQTLNQACACTLHQMHATMTDTADSSLPNEGATEKKKKNVFSIYKYGSEGHRDHKIFVSTENSGALLFSMKRVILYGVKSHRLPFRNREYSRRIRLLTSNVYFIIIFYKYYFISCYFGFESRPGPLIACIHAISHA